MRPPRGQPPPGPGQPLRAGGEAGQPQRPPPPHPSRESPPPSGKARTGTGTGTGAAPPAAEGRAARARGTATGRRKGPAGRAAGTGVRRRSAPAADSGRETGSAAPFPVSPSNPPGNRRQRTDVPARGRLTTPGWEGRGSLPSPGTPVLPARPPPGPHGQLSGRRLHGLPWPALLGWPGTGLGPPGSEGTGSFHRLGHDSTPKSLSCPVSAHTGALSLVSGTPLPASLHAYQLNRELNATHLLGCLSFPLYRSSPRDLREVPHAVTGYLRPIKATFRAGRAVHYVWEQQPGCTASIAKRSPGEARGKRVRPRSALWCSVKEDQLLTAMYACKVQRDKQGSCCHSCSPVG
ncbi:basic salivary proline-rich protein 4-like [Harpia harpyja]|uniref:basic salivary proline-rich protein 4-like n=1 Tax=Harpia harpyja TaxID=202280 RepID=UPI0022B15B56|nr:basic salivary proline-rich protein 4-like [Harpia harpyja]